ncbi:MAG TPA: GNAT family N-acetyltransferase [Flavitalea sp.]|nr:GNAT family N-acetyltransferase [Flavitalea sp.]
MIREATPEDIPAIQAIRHAVIENVLSDPGLVTDTDCHTYITNRGKGWVYMLKDQIIGFAIADLQENNIWALFVHPDHEHRGYGRMLHDNMLNWYFSQTTKSVWLSTSPDTRAEYFYRTAGWQEDGLSAKGEILFRMKYDRWWLRDISHGR